MKRPLPVELVRSVARPDRFPAEELPEVAVVGRSNVGKSSLLNRLTGTRGLAFVSKTPGRTQVANFFRLGNEMVLVDLPGYGFARAPAAARRHWEELVTSYLFARKSLRLVLLLVDLRRDPPKSDLEVRDLLEENGIAYAVVATKSDKLGRQRQIQQSGKLRKVYGSSGRVPIVVFSAVTGEGRKELWKAIEKHVLKAK